MSGGRDNTKKLLSFISIVAPLKRIRMDIRLDKLTKITKQRMLAKKSDNNIMMIMIITVNSR